MENVQLIGGSSYSLQNESLVYALLTLIRAQRGSDVQEYLVGCCASMIVDEFGDGRES
jgi:hypothetical protein